MIVKVKNLAQCCGVSRITPAGVAKIIERLDSAGIKWRRVGSSRWNVDFPADSSAEVELRGARPPGRPKKLRVKVSRPPGRPKKVP